MSDDYQTRPAMKWRPETFIKKPVTIPNPLRLFASPNNHNTELAVCPTCGALLYRRHLDFHTWWHDRTETT